MQAARGPALLAPSFPAQVSGKMVERSGAARKMAWSVTASCSPFQPVPPPPPLPRRVRQVSRSCGRRRWGRRRWPTQSKLLGDRRGRSAVVAAASPEEVAEGTTSTSCEYSGSSARAQLDLLEQLASGSDSESEEGFYRPTIRERLSLLVDGRIGDFTIPLGKRLDVRKISLTISQKRNIKRQAYLNKVSRRNDSQFFATIGAFVLVPPLLILAIGILTGYIQLFP